MSEKELKNINSKLIDVLSEDKGYFGRINTWEQRLTKYEFIGYKLDTDFLTILDKMSPEQKKNLVKIINYFDIHAGSLKRMLVEDKKESLYDFYSEWAWSHFMTVVMFGMLEVAVKITDCVVWNNKKKRYINKHKSIKSFLETYLPQNIRNDLVKKYKTEDDITLNSFSEVVEHLWIEIRSGFIHDAGINYKGLEWTTFEGVGTKEDPITIGEDVPMQELMKITWLAILRSYGYQGSLELPKYKN